MSKYKIEIEIDVDFQKYFDDIPEGLFKEKTGSDEHYEKGVIEKGLRNAQSHAALMHVHHLKQQETYPYAKHHCQIEDEVCKQIANNAKIIKIE